MNIKCDKCSYVITLSEEDIKKIPPGKQATVVCPNCERKFSISFGKPAESGPDAEAPKPPPAPAEPAEAKKESKGTPAGDSPNAADALFGFMEDDTPAAAPAGKPKGKTDTGQKAAGGGASRKESLDDIISSDMYDASDKPFDFVEEEGKTALVCESDPKLKGPIVENLNLMEYHITEVENSRSALKKMRYHIYDVIVVNETFDTTTPDQNVVLIYLERLSMSVRRNIFVAMLSNRFRTMDNMVALQKSADIIINTKNIKDVGKILSRGVTDKDFFYRSFKDALISMHG